MNTPALYSATSYSGQPHASINLQALCDDGLLIGYVETPDWDAALAGMAKEPVNARWQLAMKDYFEALEGVNPDEAMRPLQEVFHLA